MKRDLDGKRRRRNERQLTNHLLERPLNRPVKRPFNCLIHFRVKHLVKRQINRLFRCAMNRLVKRLIKCLVWPWSQVRCAEAQAGDGVPGAGQHGGQDAGTGLDEEGERKLAVCVGGVCRGRRCRAMGVGLTLFGVPGSRWTRGARLGVNGSCALGQGLRQQACLVQGTCLLWLVVCLKTTAKQQQQ